MELIYLWYMEMTNNLYNNQPNNHLILSEDANKNEEAIMLLEELKTGGNVEEIINFLWMCF